MCSGDFLHSTQDTSFFQKKHGKAGPNFHLPCYVARRRGRDETSLGSIISHSRCAAAPLFGRREAASTTNERTNGGGGAMKGRSGPCFHSFTQSTLHQSCMDGREGGRWGGTSVLSKMRRTTTCKGAVASIPISFAHTYHVYYQCNV